MAELTLLPEELAPALVTTSDDPSWFSTLESLLNSSRKLCNLSPAELYEHAVKNEKRSAITSTGALVIHHGGNDEIDILARHFVSTDNEVWCGKCSNNSVMTEPDFKINRQTAVDYLKSLDKFFINDQFLNCHFNNRIKVRIISARASHALVMHNMCIQPTPEELTNFGTPDLTMYNAGQFRSNCWVSSAKSSTSINVNFGSKEIVILGTEYCGEMVNGVSIFMQYLMPKQQILPLQCICNMGHNGDVTLFFGTQGRRIYTDPHRRLIGTSQHCWSEGGVSSIHGGCYDPCLNLSSEEHVMWNAIKFGTVLENVVVDSHTRVVNYDDGSITENTRVSYPIDLVPYVVPHPKNIILITSDSYNVIPAVCKLSWQQTMYYFICGYTSIQGHLSFEPCYSRSLAVLHPFKYAIMLAHRMQRFGARGWLVNQNLLGESYTKTIINEIHSDRLLQATYTTSPVFRFEIPTAVEGVPSNMLDPASHWLEGTYMAALKLVAKFFHSNFTGLFCEFGEYMPMLAEVMDAGPEMEV